MKRIDIVYQALLKEYKGSGVTTMRIAELTDLSRANVSNDLNKLVELGKARKEAGKPVLYQPIIKLSKLEQFARDNQTLDMIISQAKAAVLYPPKGLNMLIYGETGVGKSMLAHLIYDYAKCIRQTNQPFPFVQFNCADYANNPQLLLGQLFGVSRSAYTGAEEERSGLVEEANGGILFLDEIHRLPPEGQEMLFTFIDRGVYHRLGESHIEKKASVQLIAATTEAPNSALLQTFQRRIPMLLTMPNLAERTIEERANLIFTFFQQEANRVNETIKVTKNSIRAFLSYNCPNNIGQLKSDIQLACAKAYANFLVMSHKEIVIHSPELPTYILNGLYTDTKYREEWNTMNSFVGNYVVFTPSCEQNTFSKNHQETIYDLIYSNSNLKQVEKLDYGDIQTILENNFESVFPFKYDNKSNLEKLKTVISEPLYNICIDTINLAEKLLRRELNTKLKHSFAIHIFTTYNRIKRGDLPKRHEDEHKILEEYPKYTYVAKECLLYLNAAFDIEIPMEELPFLVMFFIYDEEQEVKQKEYVQIIVVTHGASTSTSTVNFVNTLLNTQIAWGINMNIDENPSSILNRLKQLLIDSNVKNDILFLVDMGSLANLGKEIERDLGLKCKTITLCSTLHVLEATRKSMIGAPLDEIYKDVMQINYLNNPSTPKESQFSVIPEEDKPSVILTFCLTGEGTAKTMKNILELKLQHIPSNLKIIPVTLLKDESVSSFIKHMQSQYNILCLVSSIPIETALPQFQLYDLFTANSIDKIQEIIDVDTTYREIAVTLADELKNVSSHQVVPDMKAFIRNVENIFGTHFDIKVVFGAIFHLSCLIDRLKSSGEYIDFPNKEKFKADYEKEYIIIEKLIKPLENKYEITLPEDEICYIISLFF